MKKNVLLMLLLVGHAAVTFRASAEASYLELFQFAFTGWPARQLFSDLTVSMLLISAWMVSDARKTGRNAWPFIVAGIFVGSFAPLAYLLAGVRRSSGSTEAARGN